MAEVSKEFGTPTIVGYRDGKKSFYYNHAKLHFFFPQRPESQSLQVIFDKNGIVESYDFAMTVHEDVLKIFMQHASQPADPSP